jgi:hypothetical protein
MQATPSLLETQRAMLRAIASGEAQLIASIVVSDEIGADERVSIHRNTTINALVKALRLCHPAVHRLVGSEFFEVAAQIFLEQTLPSAALLDEFGADFAAFLGAFEPAASLPYLGDVARLEWTVHHALHAPDALPMDLARLAAVSQQQSGQLRFFAHPSLGFVSVKWPADEIWRAVIAEDDEALLQMDPQPDPQWLLIQRSSSVGAQVQRIPKPHWRFASALCAGECLQDALESARNDGAGLAAAEMLGQLLADGRFTDFEICSHARQ